MRIGQKLKPTVSEGIGTNKLVSAAALFAVQTVVNGFGKFAGMEGLLNEI